MPLLISSAGSTTSMASTPLMTRFMVRSAGSSAAQDRQHHVAGDLSLNVCMLLYAQAMLCQEYSAITIHSNLWPVDECVAMAPVNPVA
jgi:hypothetical protein